MSKLSITIFIFTLLFSFSGFCLANFDDMLKAVLNVEKLVNRLGQERMGIKLISHQRKNEFSSEVKERHEFYCSNEITLKLQDLGQVTGIVVDPKTKKIVKAKGVKVILKIDKSNRRGWSIKRAYPIK